MPNAVLSLILGGGRGEHLYPLTRLRSKPAVPIAGKYRLIDIPLSNLINSGFNRVYVLTQFLSVSLHRHIANTYNLDPFSRGFIGVLPAQQTNEAADWYKGTADAVRHHQRYVQEDGCREILVLPGDQLYRMDFGDLLRAHREARADVTIAAAPVLRGLRAGWGILRPDEEGRVVAFVENPQTEGRLNPLRLPEGWLQRRNHAGAGTPFLASMGIYLFNRQVLVDLLAAQPEAVDFGLHIFPRTIHTRRVAAYLFRGYWDDLETVGAYHRANLALASAAPPFDFHSPEGVIYTRMRYLPASRLCGASITNCLVADGCVVDSGTRAERCVLGARTKVGRNVTLLDTVVMGADRYETLAERAENQRSGPLHLGIGDGTVIKRAIVDKDCRIGRGVRIVNRRGVENADGPNYAVRDGIVIVPRGAVIPDGTEI
jgi:glucose-1-phosphate adenylyltransferase